MYACLPPNATLSPVAAALPITLPSPEVASANLGGVSTSMEQIEVKIAYLEQANAELSDVVYRQGQELESLREQLAELLRRLDALQTPTAPSPQDDKPPHY